MWYELVDNGIVKVFYIDESDLVWRIWSNGTHVNPTMLDAEDVADVGRRIEPPAYASQALRAIDSALVASVG